MNNSPCYQLDKLIDEYEEDSRIIKRDKLIMINYPKVYVMTVASAFERRIKERCEDFIHFPRRSLTFYPKIQSLIQFSTDTPVTDKMFAKFYTFNRSTNTINLDASKFYELFGGIKFKNSVEVIFNSELTSRLAEYQSTVDNLLPLLDRGEQYEREYAKNMDIRDRLINCTFALAENAFLNLKLRRNKVAHDYINGLSDSFEDIRDFYLDAVLYVTALEKAIENLTDVQALP